MQTSSDNGNTVVARNREPVGLASRTAGMNAHLYPSLFRNETRIEKITRSVARLGPFSRIEIVGLSATRSSSLEELDDRRAVVRIGSAGLPVRFGLLAVLLNRTLWSWRVYRYLYRAQPTCVNCHSLSTLPIGVILKQRLKVHLIYDTHELETEVETSRGLRRRIAKLAERTLIRHVDAVSVVNESIARWYESEYRIANTAVVRNIPDVRWQFIQGPSTGADLRARLLIPGSHLLFLYQGIISAGRSLDKLLKVFARLPLDRHLVVIGDGPLMEDVIRAAAIHPNIHHHALYPPGEILGVIGGADVGLVLFQDTCLNHHFVSPNKMYEYLIAGVPVLGSDLPEIRRTIEPSRLGWLVEPTQAKIGSFCSSVSREDIEAARKRVWKHLSSLPVPFSWEGEERTLMSLYDTIASMREFRKSGTSHGGMAHGRPTGDGGL